MSVTVVFLGPLSDLAGGSARELAAPLDWAGLLDTLGSDIAAQLREARVHLALNGQVLADKTTLAAQDGDEIALLPPVSGG